MYGLAFLLLGVSIYFVTAAETQNNAFISSELGVATFSPNGPAGGMLVPASGCSSGGEGRAGGNHCHGGGGDNTTPSLPDLVPLLTITSPEPVETGTTVTFTSQVQNVGTGTAGQYNIIFYIDTNGDGEAEYKTSPVREARATPAGTSRSQSLDWLVPSDSNIGVWRVGYFADTHNEINESNENNNWSGWNNFSVSEPLPPPPACSDGIDNDGDGFIDHPNDPGCSSPTGDSEDPIHCSDPGADNYQAVGSCTYPSVAGPITPLPSLIPPSSPGPIILSANPRIIRAGGDSTITWNLNGNTECTYQDQAGNTETADTSNTLIISDLQSQFTFTISCTNSEQASINIIVLPTIFES